MRWDQAHPGTGADREDREDRDPATALADLTVAAVRAAVVAPEAELRRWFSWPWYWSDSLVDDLVRQRRLRRIDGHVTASQAGILAAVGRACRCGWRGPDGGQMAATASQPAIRGLG